MMICKKTMMPCQTLSMCSPFGGCSDPILRDVTIDRDTLAHGLRLANDRIALLESHIAANAVSDAALDTKGIRDAALELAAEAVWSSNSTGAEAAEIIRSLKSGGVDGEAGK